MSLFGFGKKKEEKKAPCCECSCSSCGESSVGEAQSGVSCVKVLGSGCKTCHEMYENVLAAVEKSGRNIKVEYVTDMQKVMEYGVMSMLAIVADEKVVSMGKALSKAEIEKLLGF